MRREFSSALQLAIIKRATDPNGQVHCSICGIWVKSPREAQIDHVLEEAMLSDADKARPLTIAHGQLLCLPCHGDKTGQALTRLAKAKRIEARKHGIKIKRSKTARPLKVAAGQTELQRRYGITGDEP
jgi:hypothetical protein